MLFSKKNQCYNRKTVSPIDRKTFEYSMESSYKIVQILKITSILQNFKKKFIKILKNQRINLKQKITTYQIIYSTIFLPI